MNRLNKAIGLQLLLTMLFLTVMMGQAELATASVHPTQFDTSDIGHSELILKGSWGIVPGEFLEPAPWSTLESSLRGLVQVPGDWRGELLSSGDSLEAEGFGTLLTRVDAPEVAEIGLRLNSGNRAFRVLALNSAGSVLGEMELGQVGDSKESSIPASWYADVLAFEYGPTAEPLTLLIHYSNFHHGRGGLELAPAITTQSSAEVQDQKSKVGSAMVFGIFLIMGLYHLVISFQQVESRGPLFFAALSLVLAMRELVMSGYLNAGSHYSVLGYQVQLTLEYLTMPGSMVFGSLFFLSMVQAEWYERLVHRFTVRVGLLLSAFTLLMNTTLFTEYLLVYQLYIMVCIVATLVHFGISAFAGNILSGWMVGGFAVVALGVTNDILVAQGKISTGYWASATVVFFVGLQAVLISRRFAFLQEKERSLRQRLLMRQTELATEALKAADAERQASAETLTKVKLFQEAAHHLNNPLNHILGSKDILGEQVDELKEFLEQLVNSNDTSEDEYQAYHDEVARLLDPCSESLQTIDHAVMRASSTVGLLRRLSGMDGTSRTRTSLDAIWLFVVENSDHTPPALSELVSPEHRIQPVMGDPFILGKVLIWLFDWLSVEELDSSIKVSVDSVSKSLVFHELDVTMFASARFHETQDLINTLLKSYNCECTNNDGKLMLSLPFNDFSE